jgi:chlorobactene glucosyltransferase
MHTLVLIALVVWSLTFVNTVLNLLLIPRIRAGRASTGPGRPLVSIIIPARNEERTIEATVRSFLSQTYPSFELIVVNDRSTDATGTVLDSIASGDRRLNVLHGAPPPPAWLGKPWALHQGSRKARGELLLFVDADLVYAPEAISAAVDTLEAGDAAMITLLPHMQFGSFWEHVAMPMLAIAFFMTLPSWLGNRTKSVRLALGGGTGNLIRRSVYDSFGGHESLRTAVVDDIGLARVVRRHGHRTLALRADHLISLRMYHNAREIVEGFTKNMFAALGRSYLLVLFWLVVGLVCSILPYVFALTGDVAAIVTVGLITLSRVLIFSSLRYRLDNAVLAHPLMMSLWAGIMLRSAWMTGVRGQVLWRGRIYEVESDLKHG